VSKKNKPPEAKKPDDNEKDIFERISNLKIEETKIPKKRKRNSKLPKPIRADEVRRSARIKNNKEVAEQAANLTDKDIEKMLKVDRRRRKFNSDEN
jgi:hypothetical protein